MNNEENNSNIFFSKPDNNIAKPDLMASMPTQNSSTANTEMRAVNQITQENNVQMTPNNIQKPDLMTQTSNVTPTINQSNINQSQINEQQDSQPANLIAEPNSLNQSFIMDNDEELLKAYVGKNYDKIANKQFNFAAFFFNSFYLCYRKMTLYGILLFAINLIVSLFINIFLPIIISLIIGFVFNKLYLKRAHKKINNIKVNNPSANKDTLIALCTNKGGVSIIRIILGVFVNVTIAFIVIVIAVMNGALTLFGNIISDFADKTNSGLNGEYKGVLMYDTSINIEDEFAITPIEPFQNKSDEYSYQYEFKYEEGTDVFKDCGFSLNAVQGFSDGSELVKQMAEYNSENISNNIDQATINGINWTWFSKTNSIGTTYYYGTTKDNKAYLFEYDINRGTSPECPTYRQTILNSIIEK